MLRFRMGESHKDRWCGCFIHLFLEMKEVLVQFLRGTAVDLNQNTHTVTQRPSEGDVLVDVLLCVSPLALVSIKFFSLCSHQPQHENASFLQIVQDRGHQLFQNTFQCTTVMKVFLFSYWLVNTAATFTQDHCQSNPAECFRITQFCL